MNFGPLLMKSYFVAVALVTGLTLFAGAVCAAPLEQLVQEALTNNPDLAAMKFRWEQASHKIVQAGSLMDPVLSLSFSSYPVDSFSSNETPMTGNEVKLAQAFPFPGKLESRSALAGEQARWFESVYRDTHFKVARKVKDAWYRLYFNVQAIAVTERNLDLVDDIIRLTEVRYETGSGLQQDVLKAQLQRSRITERLMTLRQQQVVIKAELNRLLNRVSVDDFDVPENLELVEPKQSLEVLQKTGREQRPMANAYRSLIDRYRLQQHLAKLNDYPDMTVWASWRFRDDALPDKGTDFVSAGVSVNLPVYRDKRRAEKAEAEAALRMAEHQAEAFQNEVAESIKNAYARMEEVYQKTRLYREGVIPQASQSLRSALSSYQVGKVEFMSLLDSLMTTYEAEMDYYRFSSEYMRSLAWLEAESTLPLIGRPFNYIE